MDYDAIVIGGGPAGLSAGIELAQAKYRVLQLEKESFGGPIINVEWINAMFRLEQSDLEVLENPRERIDAFRRMAGAEQRADLFTDLWELQLQVLKAFTAFKEKRDRARHEVHIEGPPPVDLVTRAAVDALRQLLLRAAHEVRW